MAEYKRLNDEELEAIRKRAEAATEGPWEYVGGVHKLIYTHTPTYRVANIIVEELSEEPDGEFIAHARQDVPKLLAEIERLKGMTAWYRHAAKKYAENSYFNKKEIERLRKLAHEILEDYDQSERGHIGMSANYDENKSSHEKYIANYVKRIGGKEKPE
jgi:hypothetical protein